MSCGPNVCALEAKVVFFYYFYLLQFFVWQHKLWPFMKNHHQNSSAIIPKKTEARSFSIFQPKNSKFLSVLTAKDDKISKRKFETGLKLQKYKMGPISGMAANLHAGDFLTWLCSPQQRPLSSWAQNVREIWSFEWSRPDGEGQFLARIQTLFYIKITLKKIHSENLLN